MGSRERRRAGQALDSRRRQLMQRSAAATLGLVGAGAAGQNAAGNGRPTPARPVRSVIYLFLTGGKQFLLCNHPPGMRFLNQWVW